VTATSKGDWDVTKIGAERQQTTEGGVIRLGELSVPTTAKGYEELLCWAEGFGPLGCVGVGGTISYGALCSLGT
jgi:hypothetical protein